MYDRLMVAIFKMMKREDLESRLILRVMTDSSLPTDQLEQAIEAAEAL
jgi:hypothetical protein